MCVKICGVRDHESARIVAEARPDAIGLNFYAKSARCVQPAVAKAIVAELPDDVAPVGVFVNHPADDVAAICRMAGIRLAQLHGDETPEMLATLAAAAPELRLIRAFRVGDGGLAGVTPYLQRCRELGVSLFACLLDARVPGRYGGTGELAPWDAIRADYRYDDWPPLILAGGLTPENVSAGIAAVRPWGVDTAGGVESAIGVKDRELVARFVRSARGTQET
jgi:phosphoribosylanthranilate isomerase